MTLLKAWINKGRITKLRCVLAVALLLAIIATLSPSCMERAEDTATGAASMMPFNQGPSNNIAIIAIDNSSIEQIGGLPWGKRTCLKLLKAIKDGGATIAVIPPWMTQVMGGNLPSKTGIPIVAGYAFMTSEDKPHQLKRKLLRTIAFPNAPESNTDLLKMPGIELKKIGRISARSLSYGSSNIFPDEDGVVRRQPLAVSFEGMAFPATEIVTTALANNFTPTIKQSPGGKPTGISLGDIRIPTRDKLSIIINYRRGSHTFDHFSAGNMLSGKVDKEILAGRIAIIGVTDALTKPWHMTPLGHMPHVEIEANVLENILDGRWITSLAGTLFSPLLVLMLGAFFALIGRRASTPTQLRISGTTLIGIWTLGLILEAYANVRIPIVLLTIALVLFQCTLLMWHLLMNVMPRQILMRHFSGKLNHSAATAIADNPELIEMQSNDRTATALAIDIRGFSRISAKLPPKKLSVFLKEYRATVSEILLEDEAFIESWVGDECRAFFGIPILFSNHPRRACKAALKIRKAISAKRSIWRKRFGIDAVRIGIGIHSGEIHIETQRTPRGPDITVTGSVVEVATRLRTLSRIYGTSILVSDAIEETTSGSFAFRPLDAMSIGAQSTTVIHELMGNMGLILPQMRDFMKARNAYMNGDFDRAAKLFTEILDDYPNDGPSLLLKKRSRERPATK